jgi:hypothetical protein
VFQRPDGRYTAIVLNDHREERSFVLLGEWRVLELITTSESAYEVRGDPAQVQGDAGVTVTLPPWSLVSMVLE